MAFLHARQGSLPGSSERPPNEAFASHTEKKRLCGATLVRRTRVEEQCARTDRQRRLTEGVTFAANSIRCSWPLDGNASQRICRRIALRGRREWITTFDTMACETGGKGPRWVEPHDDDCVELHTFIVASASGIRNNSTRDMRKIGYPFVYNTFSSRISEPSRFHHEWIRKVMLLGVFHRWTFPSHGTAESRLKNRAVLKDSTHSRSQ